ncbi:Probable transmembrane ascorbate ferrireductase 4 [Linum grandiflorum]
MAPSHPFTLPLLLWARISALTVAALFLYWTLLSYSSSQDSFLYAARHPLLMVIGFIFVSGEAILVHRWLPCSRNAKKLVHLGLQGVALSCGMLGMWTKFHGRKGFLANFYSLHSWMGLLCISLFAAQWLMGLVSFWYRGVRMSRLPWQVFVGLYTYALGIATAETGILERMTLLQMKPNSTVYKRSPESLMANGLGVGLFLLGGLLILAAISPKHQRKPVYSLPTNLKSLSSSI